MHPFELQGRFKTGDWSMGCYELKEDIVWTDSDQEIEVVQKSRAQKKKKIKLQVLKGAFWSDDSFAKGEEVITYVEYREYQIMESRGDICFIVSKAFFDMFISNEGPKKGVERMKSLLSMPKMMGKMALAFVSGEKKPDTEDLIPHFFDTDHLDEFYCFVEPYLLPEQRQAFKRWSESPTLGRNNHDKEKIKYLLSISPTSPFHDKYEVTYESIMEVFNKRIVGYNRMKHMIATRLAENYQKKQKRGVVIFLHGLSGTGKTMWGAAIAEALHLKHKVINLGEKSSTLSIVGCESTYDGSEPGNPLKFFYAEKTSEAVLTWDEYDKLARQGTNRGKDGNVAEALLPILDPDRAVLCDNFMDEVPIDCSNTIHIITCNRIDNVPAELLNRVERELVFYMPPYDEETLLEILNHHKESVQREYQLSDGWISKAAMKRIFKYRGDFGARDAIAFYRDMALFAKNSGRKKITPSIVDSYLSTVVDVKKNDNVRFHFNESYYSAEQREEILSTISKRTCKDNLSDVERRALDMKISYLTRLIPGKKHVFELEEFFRAADAKLYGMEEVKTSIAAEILAAEKENHHPEPILLVGSHGIGKTSLVEAVAHASGRKYIRLQMNGVFNPTFITGNMSGSVAADAGKPVQMMAEAETTSPLLYFDEIEKVSEACMQTFYGMFDDHPKIYDQFLGFSVDLSNAQLICSANDLSKIPPALLSRMKVVQVSGYTAMEKRCIGRDYLMPSIVQNLNVDIDDEAYDEILSYYETDSGIRSLKHGLNKVVHQCMLEQRNTGETVKISVSDVNRILGAKPYIYVAEKKAGCVNGLATYGDSHGMVMPVSVRMLHNGEKRITGLAADTIRESILICETWLEEEYGISLEEGYHINYGRGGIKKDGPSAGISTAIAMLSAVTGVEVGNVAFSGEFDGSQVLPVGGVKLKVQAAASAGIEKVYLPEGCRKDVDLSKYENISVVFVKRIQEVVNDLFPEMKEESEGNICERKK